MKTYRAAFVILLVVFPRVARSQPVAESAGERGWKVLEAALKAAGGREKLAAIQDMSFDLDSHVVAPQGEFDIQSKSWFMAPSTVRQQSTLPLGEFVMALDSRTGWRKGPQGTAALPATEIQRIQADLARANILLHPPADRSAVRWVTTDKVEGRLCDVIEIADVAGKPLRLAVDRANGAVLKRSYRGEAPDGRPTNVEEFVSDYRQVDGLRMSFKVRVLRDGKLARESVTRDLQINTGLKAEELMRQPQ
ncbi:MAG: hypothetical protein HY236_16545 [Acidobacteria bacterium]|nr:hypothetical protein [Acidobacteriota bacterium]